MDFLIVVDSVSGKDLAMVVTLLDSKDVNQYMGRVCLTPWDDDVQ